MEINALPIDKWEKCPNCDDSGAIWHYIHCCGGDEERCQRMCPDVEFQQCEFCYTNPNSVFNQKQLSTK